MELRPHLVPEAQALIHSWWGMATPPQTLLGSHQPPLRVNSGVVPGGQEQQTLPTGGFQGFRASSQDKETDQVFIVKGAQTLLGQKSKQNAYEHVPGLSSPRSNLAEVSPHL